MRSGGGLTYNYFWWENLHLPWRLLLHTGQSGKQGAAAMPSFIWANFKQENKNVLTWFCFALYVFRTLRVQSSVFWLSWCRADIRSLTLVLRTLKWCWTVTGITWVWGCMQKKKKKEKSAIRWLSLVAVKHQSLSFYSGVNVYLWRLSEAEHAAHQFALPIQWAWIYLMSN